jgi:hypothetical protein
MSGIVFPSGEERDVLIDELEKALNANVIQLANGDHMIVSK